MITEYKYIYFMLIDQKPKTSVWACCSHSDKIRLGIVKWHGPWRQYCFWPESGTIFNSSCLADIQDFMGQLKAAQEEAPDG